MIFPEYGEMSPWNVVTVAAENRGRNERAFLALFCRYVCVAFPIPLLRIIEDKEKGKKEKRNVPRR